MCQGYGAHPPPVILVIPVPAVSPHSLFVDHCSYMHVCALSPSGSRYLLESTSVRPGRGCARGAKSNSRGVGAGMPPLPGW